jgi:TonB family protein
MRFRPVQPLLRGVGDLKLCGRVPLTIRGFAVLAATIACFSTALPNALAQAATGIEESITGVVLVKLSPPIYPPLARQARMAGDVKLRLSIRRDGTVESGTPVSGDEALVPAALESARQSQFECRGCTQANTEYSMTYTFQVLGELDRCCCTTKIGATTGSKAEHYGVSQLQNHITLSVDPICVCPDACDADRAQAHSQFRSLKCLYLWKCGAHSVSIQ